MSLVPNNMLLNEVTSCGNYGVLNMQVVVDFLVGFRFSSWVFFISLLSPVRMARPGCSDVY